MKQHLDAIAAAAAEFERLGKSDSVSHHLAAFNKFHDVFTVGMNALGVRIDALEKRFADENAKAYGFGASDNPQAEIARLEAQIAVLRARHDGDISGLAKTLSRGASSSSAESVEDQCRSRFGGH